MAPRRVGRLELHKPLSASLSAPLKRARILHVMPRLDEVDEAQGRLAATAGAAISSSVTWLSQLEPTPRGWGGASGQQLAVWEFRCASPLPLLETSTGVASD
jgi:hypothetical protein